MRVDWKELESGLRRGRQKAENEAWEPRIKINWILVDYQKLDGRIQKTNPPRPAFLKLSQYAGN
jgi:hypothetical protein